MGRIIPDETVETTEEKPTVVVREKEVKAPRFDKSLETLYSKDRRKTKGSSKRGKFYIPEELKDPRFNYFWSTSDKVKSRESKDWSIVNDPELNKALTGKTGSLVKVFGTLDQIEKETNHILMAKRKDWCEADKTEKQDINNQIEKAIKGGVSDKVEGKYVPKGQKDVLTK